MDAFNKAVIYCRVSSDKQVRHGHGLDGQEARCRDYAKEHGLFVENVFRDEAISGGTEHRPAFYALTSYLEERKRGYVVIIDDLNRLARDVALSRALKLAIQGAGSKLACVNFNFEDTPESQYFETIVVATGEFERLKNRERVISRQKARLEAGYWVFAPPRGYRYKKISGHGKLLVPDKPNAILISELFTKFSTGELLTQSDARAFLADGGLRNRSMKTMIPTVEEAKRILTRRIYAGAIEYERWGICERVGHHEPLISRAVFEKVQKRLAGRRRAPTKSNLAHDFPLRNHVLCGGCGTPLTGSWSTGRTKKYPYYRCPNTKFCPEEKKSIPKKRLETDFSHFLQSVCPKPGVVRLAKRVTEEVWAERENSLAVRRKSARQACIAIDANIDRLLDQLVSSSSASVMKRLEARIDALESEKRQESAAAERNAPGDEEFGTALQRVFDFLGRPHQLWNNGNLEQRRIIQSLMFTGPIEYSVSEGFGTTKFSLPFKLLQLDRQEEPELVEAAGIEPASASPLP